MGSLFSRPKFPALPPVQPAPEPPSTEISAEEKEAIAKNRQQLKENEEVENLQYLLLHLAYKKMKNQN
tara:strand:+ start:31 stop:234 length:204 start_codon:yes stop_codon:yes gene_type:complete